MTPPNRTKVVATLGPATSAPKVLRDLVRAGVDIFRVNYAHGDHAGHQALVRRLRAEARRLGVRVAVLADLPGPKIRVGGLPPEGLKVSAGQEVLFTAGEAPRGPLAAIPFPQPKIIAALRPGHQVFIADGALRFLVRRAGKQALARAEVPGTVRRGNGINLPDTPLRVPAFTRADAAHLLAARRAGVDMVGLSFVSDAPDIERARRFAARRGFPVFLVAKIERPAALKNLNAIVQAADGVMVARGDLGVELPFAQVPGLQAEIVREARRLGKPVIVATQVLESMVSNPRPTRAEATDIAHAVWSGADAIMLSGETSIGKHPLAAVRALEEVITATERRPPPWNEQMPSSLTIRGWPLNLSDYRGAIGDAPLPTKRGSR